jgi:hypothetical protein
MSSSVEIFFPLTRVISFSDISQTAYFIILDRAK